MKGCNTICQLVLLGISAEVADNPFCNYCDKEDTPLYANVIASLDPLHTTRSASQITSLWTDFLPRDPNSTKLLCLIKVTIVLWAWPASRTWNHSVLYQKGSLCCFPVWYNSERFYIQTYIQTDRYFIDIKKSHYRFICHKNDKNVCTCIYTRRLIC